MDISKIQRAFPDFLTVESARDLMATNHWVPDPVFRIDKYALVGTNSSVSTFAALFNRAAICHFMQWYISLL